MLMSLIDTGVNEVVKPFVLIVLPNKLNRVGRCVWGQGWKNRLLLLADRAKESLESRPNKEHSEKGIVANDRAGRVVVELDTNEGLGKSEAIDEA